MRLNQLEILSYIAIIHQPVTSNTCGQTYVQIKHSLAHLQDLIPTLADIRYNNTNESRPGLNLVDVLYLYMHLATCVWANSYRLVHIVT